MQKKNPAKSSNHSFILFNTYIKPLPGPTTPRHRGPGSIGNEGVLPIPQ